MQTPIYYRVPKYQFTEGEEGDTFYGSHYFQLYLGYTITNQHDHAKTIGQDYFTGGVIFTSTLGQLFD